MGKWPSLYKIKQSFNNQPVVHDIEAEVLKQMDYILMNNHLPKGSRVAITAGSQIGRAHV